MKKNPLFLADFIEMPMSEARERDYVKSKEERKKKKKNVSRRFFSLRQTLLPRIFVVNSTMNFDNIKSKILQIRLVGRVSRFEISYRSSLSSQHFLFLDLWCYCSKNRQFIRWFYLAIRDTAVQSPIVRHSAATS